MAVQDIRFSHLPETPVFFTITTTTTTTTTDKYTSNATQQKHRQNK